MNPGKLKELRQEKGLSLEALADKVGTSRQNIHRYEKGVINNVPPERILAIARALDVSPDVLMGWDQVSKYKNSPQPQAPSLPDTSRIKNKEDFIPLRKGSVPILGEIACGNPIVANQEYENYVSGEDLQVDFCLRAHGNSMIGARINDGDLVFIRKQDSVENGEIAAVVIGDEATLKRVYDYPDEQKLILLPENPHFAPLVYINDELSDVHILGKAVAFQSAVV